ncbi:MAG TPA: group III truncated hemoglobin [Ilumatobacteraceae bacterium]|nr:group III truncated hemoglobin [Ilumatobacteraceae bacterium]
MLEIFESAAWRSIRCETSHGPTPTGDLDTPGEIAELVRRFYADVTQDDLLGPMFNEVARVDWSEHLPKLTAFWSRALLGIPGYQGNPFRAHLLVHAQREFTPTHFERWLALFHETIAGPGPTPDERSTSPTTSPVCTATSCRATRSRPARA